MTQFELGLVAGMSADLAGCDEAEPVGRRSGRPASAAVSDGTSAAGVSGGRFAGSVCCGTVPVGMSGVFAAAGGSGEADPAGGLGKTLFRHSSCAARALPRQSNRWAASFAGSEQIASAARADWKHDSMLSHASFADCAHAAALTIESAKARAGARLTDAHSAWWEHDQATPARP